MIWEIKLIKKEILPQQPKVDGQIKVKTIFQGILILLN